SCCSNLVPRNILPCCAVGFKILQKEMFVANKSPTADQSNAMRAARIGECSVEPARLCERDQTGECVSSDAPPNGWIPPLRVGNVKQVDDGKNAHHHGERLRPSQRTPAWGQQHRDK